MADDYFNPDDYEGIQEKKAAVPRSQIRKWEQAEKELAEVKAQMASIQREQVFSTAGIPNEGPGAWFRKGYDGELTVEAVRQAYGFQGGSTPGGTQAATQQALAGHAAAAAMSAGAGSANTSGTDAELATLYAQARKIKNPLMLPDQNEKLDGVLRQAGVPTAIPDGTGWTFPGAMKQG